MNLMWKLLHEEEATEQKNRGPYRTETRAVVCRESGMCTSWQEAVRVVPHQPRSKAEGGS